MDTSNNNVNNNINTTSNKIAICSAMNSHHSHVSSPPPSMMMLMTTTTTTTAVGSSNTVATASRSAAVAAAAAMLDINILGAASADAVSGAGSGAVRLSKKRSLCDITSTSNPGQMPTSNPVVRILSAPRMIPLSVAATGTATAATTTKATATTPRSNNCKQLSRPIDVLVSILRSTSTTTPSTNDATGAFADANKNEVRVIPYQDIPSDFYLPFTDAEMDAYCSELLNAVRSQDLDALRKFHKAGRPLKCSNRFGESLLHLACRKGFADVVDLLINEAGVPLRVKDDFGRNPAHDACWTVTPNWTLMDLIIASCPDLFLVKDVRGHTPLDYIRREHWTAWTEYLQQKGMQLAPRILVSTATS
jgi:ankyrin repeat protein